MAMLFGRHPVLEGLRAGDAITRILLAKEAHGPIIETILQCARQSNVLVKRVSKEEIDALAPYSVHQGVVADTMTPLCREYSLVEVLEGLQEAPSPPFLLILDSIEDPRNLGALIRSANGAGVQGVIIPKQRASGITPAAVKTSAGATEHTPIIKVTNLVQTCSLLKKRGLWIIGTDATARDSWYQVDYTSPIAIVLGGEGRGMHRLLREECDFIVRIPMLGQVGSLNVGVAGGVLMYEVARQRLCKGIIHMGDGLGRR